jgi:hypothetical protein
MKRLALILICLCAVGARADLKTWLHGPQEKPTPGPPDAKAAAVSFAPNIAADKTVLDFMEAFAEALRVHDGKSLKSRLSERYMIDDLPDENDPVDFFMQAMVKVKAPDEIVITAVERDGETRVAKMEFRAAGRETTQRTFRFDSSGKLISADFFALKRQHGG